MKEDKIQVVNNVGQPWSYRAMYKVRSKMPRRFQYNLTMIGLTILVVIASAVYLICNAVWKLLWPIRKLVSKIKAAKKKQRV